MTKRKKIGFRLGNQAKPKLTLSQKLIIGALTFLLLAGGGAVIIFTGTSTRTTSQSGPWSDPATWGGATSPAISDAVVINHTVTITANCNADKITVNAGGCLTGDGGAYLFTIDGTSGDDLQIDGTFNANGTTLKINRNNQLDGTGAMNFYKIDLSGKTLKIKNTCTSTINFNGTPDPFLNPGTLTPGNGCSICFNGSAAQDLSSDASVKFNNLIINNSAGVTLQKNFTTGNLLGNLSIQTGTLFNNGFSITGASGNTLSITNGATLNASGLTTAFSGFGTTVLGPSSTVNYSGSTQAIASATYGALVISGAGTKTMNGNASVNTLALTAGNILLNGKTLTVNNSSPSALTRTSGTITSELTNNTSKLKWNIGTSTGSFLFPFANTAGIYVPFTFDITSAGIGAGDITVSTYSTSTNNLPYPSGVTNVNANGADNSTYTVDRFWQVDAGSYSTNPAATLIFTASATEAGAIGAMRAQRWNGSSWDNPLPAQTYAVNSVTVNNVSAFSTWTLAGTTHPLPIVLMNFDAVVKNEEVNINWTTASESNNDFFTIERSSNGIDFEAVEKIKGAGNCVVKKDYSAIDTEPISGTSYYRLRQTDYNGKTEKFNKVAITFNSRKTDKNFEITKTYPNPFSNEFKMDIDSKKAAILTMQLISLDGRVVKQESVHCEEGNNIYSYMDDATMADGTYILTMSDGNGDKTSTRIIKKK